MSRRRAPRAVIFDFNGTIVNDHSLMSAIYADVLARRGVAFARDTYTACAGLPDEALFREIYRRRGLELRSDDADALVQERVRLYKEGISPAHLRPGVREFVLKVSRRLPVAIASGAFRDEIEHALRVVRLDGVFRVIVGIDDVTHGKPHPDGFRLALARLNADLGVTLDADCVWVIEDATAGARAARAGGFRCCAVRGPEYDEACGLAEVVVDELDTALVERLTAT